MSALAAAAKAPAFAIPAMQGKAPPRARADSRFLPPLASLAAIPAQPAVQRKCGGCAAEEKEELPVRARLEVGPVGDRYEREADAIAGKVMAIGEGDISIAAPAVQRAFGDAPEENEESEESAVQPRLEAGPGGDRHEREADAIAAEAMSAAPAVQRACSACAASDDEPRARRIPDEEESFSGAAEEPEDRVRARRAPAADGPETIAASHGDLTGGGAPLPAATRGFFEARMGRDLSGVRVHEGGAAQSLNSSIAARAFTYRNHVWLGGGERASPSFTMAHELAHVMQQTAPGPIGPQRREEASAASASVRRKPSPFWLPLNVGVGAAAKGQHEAIHNGAQKRVREKNADILTEVPIPGANRKVISTDKCGFADLYSAKPIGSKIPVPGVEAVLSKSPAAAAAATPAAAPASQPAVPPTGAPASQPAAAAPVYTLNNFTQASSKASCGDRIGANLQSGKGPVIHENVRAPKLSSSGALIGMADAPEDIKVGEVKPAHDLKYRGAGDTQVDNYLAGLKTAIAETNKVAAARGQTKTWKGNPTRLDIPAKNLPQGWAHDGTGGGDWPIKSCKIRAYDMVTKTVKPKGKSKAKPKTYTGPQAKDVKQGRPVNDPIRGRWVFAQDPPGGGLYVYSLVPNPDDLKTALGRRSTSAEFKDLVKSIDAIHKPLITPPEVPKVKKRPLAGAASPARPAVRREVKDTFSAKAWDAARVGRKDMPDESKDNLLDRYDAGVDNETREGIMEAAGMVQWLRDNPNVPETSYPSPTSFAGITEDAKDLKSLAFWTSIKAKPLGFLREKFGGGFTFAYRKAIEFRENIKKKFSEKKDKDFLGSKKGTIYKAISKILAVVVPRIAAPFVRSMFNTIVDCGISGFKAKLHELIKGTPIDDLFIMAEKIDAQIHEMAADVEAYFTNLVTDTFGPIKDKFEAFIGETKFLLDVAGMVQEMAKAARVGSCVAGLISAPETVGIGAVVGCGAALGDYILSKFGLSPVEYFIAMTLESCDSQNFIGRGIAAMNFLKSLSQQAGVAIIKKAKEILGKLPGGEFAGKPFGQHAAELFCDPSGMTFPSLDYTDVNCKDTPGFRKSKTGDYVIPDGVVRFKAGDPKGPEKKHMGWDGSEKDEAPWPPPDKPPAPPAAPASTGTGTGAGAGSGGVKAEMPDSLAEGHIVNPVAATINLEIRGGFSATHKYDGKKYFPAALIGTDQDLVHYGPLPVNIYVIDVIDTKPGYRIRFKFLLKKSSENLVLTDGQTGKRFEIFDSAGEFNLKLRGVNSEKPAEPPKEKKEKKKKK
jgi:hypothetical protein